MMCPGRVTGVAAGAPRPEKSAHPWHMAPATTPPRPGNLTVPVLFGWEFIVVVLLLVVGLAVVFVVLSAAGRNVSERAELQAWLDARTHGSGEQRGPGTPVTGLRAQARHDVDRHRDDHRVEDEGRQPVP